MHVFSCVVHVFRVFLIMETINVKILKRKIQASGFRKEQVVAAVQDEGIRFSLTQLDKMFKGEMPVNNLEEIIFLISNKIKCDKSDFYYTDAA